MNENESVLPNYLEADQLAEQTSRPVPRAVLRRRTTMGLWALRVFVVAMSAIVIYAFTSHLG